MNDIIKLLWIDDNLFHDLTEKRMALYMEEDIEPHFATDATDDDEADEPPPPAPSAPCSSRSCCWIVAPISLFSAGRSE